MRALRSFVVVGVSALLVGPGCTAVATTPAWVGGGLAVSAPLRQAAEEAEQQKLAEQAAREPKEIGARHILVMHKDSQRKPDGVTRSRDEAKQRAQECLLKLRGGSDFEAMVKEYSDEPGAVERGGDLGIFGKGAMVKAFADTAFALDVDEVSEIVETQFGFHIIQRTE